jgi:DNA-binding Lrp family transcriptional regulator
MAKSNALRLLNLPPRPIQQPGGAAALQHDQPNPTTPLPVQHGLPPDEPQNMDLIESGTPETGTPERGIPGAGTPESGIPAPVVSKSLATSSADNKLRYVREAQRVQDGHSLGEQLVLTLLWNEADSVKGQDYRRITIGYRTLSSMCGLTVNNCKANLKALQAKLAIESETSYSNSLATTYRVYSFTEILARRRSAGLTHVIRNRGVVFVHSETGIPVSGTPVLKTGIPETGTGGVPETDEKGIPVTGTLLRNKKELQETSSSDAAIVGEKLRMYIAIDDDAVRQIVASCREAASDATGEEIAYFARIVVEKHRRNDNIKNLTGLMIRGAVAKYFQAPASELAAFRAEHEAEKKRSRELAQEILDEPRSSDQERQWARQVLRQ